MYQHIAHQLSLRTLEELFSEFFGLKVGKSEIHAFKLIMACHYQTTYTQIMERILRGHVLYVDETEVRLKTGKGYVWIFANLENVVYMYRPSRDGDFLKKLLATFQGVLVSDFYAAYDSMDCPQQKCLIHLLRDMNQILLDNPFDTDVQLLTRSFGSLLRLIVTAIDKHGLKRRYLERYSPKVTTFFRRVISTRALSLYVR